MSWQLHFRQVSPVTTGQQAVRVQDRGAGVEALEERKYLPCET